MSSTDPCLVAGCDRPQTLSRETEPALPMGVCSDHFRLAERSCCGKTRCRTREKALNRARQCAYHHATAYHCPACRRWHVGERSADFVAGVHPRRAEIDAAITALRRTLGEEKFTELVELWKPETPYHRLTQHRASADSRRVPLPPGEYALTDMINPAAVARLREVTG